MEGVCEEERVLRGLLALPEALYRLVVVLAQENVCSPWGTV